MKQKFKEIFTNWRVILLLIFIVCSLILIRPSFEQEGVAIRSIEKGSAAYEANMMSPSPRDKPMLREIILKVDGVKVQDIDHFYELISTLNPEDIVRIESLTHFTKTEAGREHFFSAKEMTYTLTVQPEVEIIILNETEEKTIEITELINQTINGTTIEINQTINKTIIVNKTQENVIGTLPLGITVYEAPTSNIKKGLDLSGGTRVLLEPAEKVSDTDMDIVLANLKERLNVYGLSDIVVRTTKDLEGNVFILVEIAGATEDEVKNLIAGQGKFEAKIGNDIVFSGGDDVRSVCRSADCAFVVKPGRPCTGTPTQGYACTFAFSITMSTEAAQRQSDITSKLSVLNEGGYQYLSEPLDLYLDDELVDSLRIGADLRGRAVTDIEISGPGFGMTQQEAIQDSANGMKQLQTVLITGSLPVKLNIVKIDTISPVLGKEFINNALIMGLLAILAVAIVTYIRFRSFKISIPIIVTMLSEVILLLGMAALIGWNLDLAAIAGIIIAVGTGVDHQIVIADEVLRKEHSSYVNWKQKIKRAFFIIMAAYFTTVVAMLPLIWAGAGLVKGFAITTILGVTIGVFITRPAFAAMVEILLKE
jgi:preprotein translocase subunit SecD